MSILKRAFTNGLCGVLVLLVLLSIFGTANAQEVKCSRTITVFMVALDQPFMWNRLGAAQPQGMIFALARDVVPLSTPIDANGNDDLSGIDLNKPGHINDLVAGKVRLRTSKRPRPITLRVNKGDCLEIHFKNLLSPRPKSLQPNTRYAGVHIMGLELVGSIDSDASWVGKNPGVTGSLVKPGDPQPDDPPKPYKYYAAEEGNFVLYSAADPNLDQVAAGLFGSVNVQPEGAEWYRSQVTRTDLEQATYFVGDPGANTTQVPITGSDNPPADNPSNYQPKAPDPSPYPQMTISRETTEQDVWTLTTVYPTQQHTIKHSDVLIIDNRLHAKTGQPLINYNALKDDESPVLSMLWDHDDILELIYTDLTAIITGPMAGRFPYNHTSPSFRTNPAAPDRRQPYREYTIIYHHAAGIVQAFSQFYDSNLQSMLRPGKDEFAINYGTGGISAEILANRLGVGPMGHEDSVDLKYEEFFLSAWSVGDPAMVVDVPANAPNQVVSDPAEGAKITDQGNKIISAPTAQTFEPLNTKKATKAFYPDDPSNVYHSYMRDHVKFRISNVGPGPAHIHHLHAHQWLHSPNSDNGHYLDSQTIVPGVAYTLEITYNGSGNRNQTVGDSIFHCHFYPHFAAGMWSMWRVHDVFEEGTKLDPDGKAALYARALPDGEIVRGTPIPAIVPLPTIGMAPMPAAVHLNAEQTITLPGVEPPLDKITIDAGRRAVVVPENDGEIRAALEAGNTNPPAPVYKNPGYPFFIPGVAGHRPPHPPLDFAWQEDKDGKPILDENGKKKYLDGGLPRHQVLDGNIVLEFHTRWDFTKDFILYDAAGKANAGGLIAYNVPEDGTAVEKAAMKAHATRTHATALPNGDPGNFILNGLPPIHGAPYAAPDVSDDGNSTVNTRRYKAAVIQMDVVFNKEGWHYPQQRFLTLWEDVKPTVDGIRPPQPFFFRSNTGDSIEFWHTDLVPVYYELDDFQVRTPTDVIGQHIHLVKFDVTSSDGAENGFNYEDGTFSPGEVRDRINAINFSFSANPKGLFGFDDGPDQFINTDTTALIPVTIQKYEEVYKNPDGTSLFGDPPPFQDWNGAQTTIQRWDTDPLLNNQGDDRTLRTVFTHDHFSPSTHQQVGLYAGLLVQPENAQWEIPVLQDDGSVDYVLGGTRNDGGPTSWQANILTGSTDDPTADSYREFVLEFQDTALAYTNLSTTTLTNPSVPIGTDTLSSAVFNVTDSDLSPSTVNEVVTALNAGTIPADLKTVFSARGINLSDDATVSGKTFTDPIVTGWEIKDTGGKDQGETFFLTEVNSNLNVYTPTMHPGWADSNFAINPPPSDSNPTPPYPTIVSGGGQGTYVLNYRNEPTPLRVNTAARVSDAGKTPASPTNPTDAQDLAYVFNSITRFDPDLNRQPDGLVEGKRVRINPGNSDPPYNPCEPDKSFGFYFPGEPLVPKTDDPYTFPTGGNGAKGGLTPTDPYTPLLRVYENDKVQIRTLVGAHLNTHVFQMHGVKWLFEPSYTNSGYRNFQTMSLSEHFEMLFTVPPATTPLEQPFADYLYAGSSGVKGLTSGLWGIMRAYDLSQGEVDGLDPLPNNDGTPANVEFEIPGTTVRRFNITAVTAASLPPFGKNGKLIYNSRGDLVDPNALIYVRTEDLDSNFHLKEGVRVEPLILRAAAGDWIEITLTNGFNPLNASFEVTLPLGNLLVFPTSVSSGNASTDVNVSKKVGLHPQLVSYDITEANGVNIGYNLDQTVSPGETRTFHWYAGNLSVKDDGTLEATPVEFGVINLTPADMLAQASRGLIGALVIEPEGSTWVEDVNSRASATVTKADGSTFREFVVVMQNLVEYFDVKNFALLGGINYKSEPRPQAVAGTGTPPEGYSKAFSNKLLIKKGEAATVGDPQTPVFVAGAGTPVRFRMLMPGGDDSQLQTMTIHGHVWQEEPFVNDGTEIGDNPLSQAFGSQQIGPYEAYNMVLDSAGGKFKVTGDYLYDSFGQAIAGGNGYGIWGIFRVSEPGQDAVVINKAELSGTTLTVSGVNTVNPDTGKFAAQVAILTPPPPKSLLTEDEEFTVLGVVNVITENSKDDSGNLFPVEQWGTWTFTKGVTGVTVGTELQARSVQGGGTYDASVTQGQ